MRSSFSQTFKTIKVKNFQNSAIQRELAEPNEENLCVEGSLANYNLKPTHYISTFYRGGNKANRLDIVQIRQKNVVNMKEKSNSRSSKNYIKETNEEPFSDISSKP